MHFAPQCGVPILIVRLMWNLLREKILHFFAGKNEKIIRTGYIGLPQGSVLFPFFYNFYTRLADQFLHPLVSILQDADDIVIYSIGRETFTLETYVQSSLQNISEFFNKLGLTISARKSESMIFSWKQQTPQLRISLDDTPKKHSFVSENLTSVKLFHCLRKIFFCDRKKNYVRKKYLSVSEKIIEIFCCDSKNNFYRRKMKNIRIHFSTAEKYFL
jgi:Reverse transcriptase (RNA-dependent DNA polymerase)